LPTEAEWEKAARGGCELYETCKTEMRIFPWGNEQPSCAHAVIDYEYNEEGEYKECNDQYPEIMPVGSKPLGQSPYGVMDMVGNGDEWVSDFYSQDYYLVSPIQNPQGADQPEGIVAKGIVRGSAASSGCSKYDGESCDLRSSRRNVVDAYSSSYTSIRCARSMGSIGTSN
jgi:formylglycine-generating enzyme required for sulfatase activity